MFKKFSFVFTVSILTIFLSGCLELEEKTTIGSTGECDMRFTMRVSSPGKKESQDLKKSLKEEKIKKGLKEVDGLSLTDYSVKDLYGQVVVNMKFHADKCKMLGTAYEKMPSELQSETEPSVKKAFSKEGFYEFKKRGKKIVITRTIEQTGKKKKKKKKAEKDFGDELAAMMLGGMKMRFDLVVPTRIISSNAESTDGNTLVWVIPMSYLDKKKIVLKAEIEATPELTQQLIGK